MLLISRTEREIKSLEVKNYRKLPKVKITYQVIIKCLNYNLKPRIQISNQLLSSIIQKRTNLIS